MSLSSYLITCLTEGIRIVSDYTDTIPTTCPHNTAHTIDPTQTKVYATLATKQVTINHADIPGTFLYYMALGFPSQAIAAGPGVSTTISYTVLYPVLPRLFTIYPNEDESNTGDTVSVYAAPNTTIGTITANANIGDTQVTVDNNVMLNVYNGFLVSITDGVNIDVCGFCLTINSTTQIVTFVTPLTHAYAAGSYFQITVPRVLNLPIASIGKMQIGLNNLHSVMVPPGTLLTFVYTNNSSSAKTVNFFMEYSY